MKQKKNKIKELSLHFVGYGTYRSEHWNPDTHEAGRIEIWINNDMYNKEEIEVKLPIEIYRSLKEKLNGLEIKVSK